MTSWYYAVGSRTEGPVTEDELRSLARRAELTPSSYVVPEGDSVWRRLGEVETQLGLTRNQWGSYADAPAGVTDAPQGWPTVTPQQGWPANQPPQGQPQPPAPGGWSASAPAGPGPGWGAAQPGGWSSDHPMYAGPYAVGSGGPGGAAFAEWWQRLLAKLIDFLILLIPAVIVFLAVLGDAIRDGFDSDNGTFNTTFSSGQGFAASVAVGLVGYAYYAVLNGRGQTLGKMALGIKVVRMSDGAPIGFGKGLLRHLIQFLEVASIIGCLAIAFVLVDSLWPLWDERKQALHDKMAGSAVIKTR